jgi:hypothetical protein
MNDFRKQNPTFRPPPPKSVDIGGHVQNALTWFSGLSNFGKGMTLFPVLFVGGLVFAKFLDPNGEGRARQLAEEAKHAAYVAKCKPLKDKYLSLNIMNSAYDGSDIENARIDLKVCEAGETVDKKIEEWSRKP